MQYLKLTSGPTIIEFHNSWLGEETVTVNNKIVSKKASIYGAQHYFTVSEKSDQVNYLLISKVSGSSLDVLLDLFKNGVPVCVDIPLPYGSKPKTPSIEAKIEGLKKMKEYDMSAALEAFKKSLTFDPNDAEAYFNMACIYSNLEKEEEAFDCLRNAVSKGLNDTSLIHSHELLAFVRVQSQFDTFVKNGYK